MKKRKSSIQTTLVISSLACILVLCLLLSASFYFPLSIALRERYQDKLMDVLTYVEHQADADDLRACVESGVPSESYARFQAFLNEFIDDFELTYLYIVIPRPEEGLMINVISATSAAEFAAGETDMPLLEKLDAYPRSELESYFSYWDAEEIGYFEESSDYGTYYTACKPLRDSNGETVALICADIPSSEMHRTIGGYVRQCVAVTLLCGLVFAFFLIRWLRRNVTKPVQELEKSARSFAERSHSLRDLRDLEFEMPEIRANNEVRSLAESVFKMASDLKTGVEKLISSEARAASAESKAENMTQLAFQDPLTHVKSKTAYESRAEELTADIAAGNACFAMVMADMNELKEINDAYGHDCGDKYLVGACKLICQVYKHSPVYRVGGDEFVVLLQGADYDDRDALLEELRERWRQTCEEPGREPWERFSAAAGMAVYGEAPDDTVQQVLDRADERMYAEKAQMKAARLR